MAMVVDGMVAGDGMAVLAIEVALVGFTMVVVSLMLDIMAILIMVMAITTPIILALSLIHHPHHRFMSSGLAHHPPTIGIIATTPKVIIPLYKPALRVGYK
jgi:hypothetical protein